MKYQCIPRIEKELSRVAQGTMMLQADRPDWSFELLDAVYETGINTFDAAHVYGGGDCDRVFGKWVDRRDLRDKIVLMDKCCHPNKDRRRVTPADITTDLMDCLARLDFAAIDLFVMHRDDTAVPVGPLVETFNEHIDAGRIGAYGGSNWSHERIQEANRYADDHGLVGMTVSSPHFSLAESLDDPWGGTSLSITGASGAAARAWYAETQMPVLPWSSLSGGFFSGRFGRDNLDSLTESADTRCIRCYCGEENFRRLDRAQKLAEKKGATAARIALAWVLCGPLNCIPLMAAHTPQQARDNALAVDVDLTDDEVAWLNLET